MTIHWPSLDRQGRIEALKAIWTPGTSMSVLAARLGTTRNAISGLYSRCPEIRETHPLQKPNQGTWLGQRKPRPPKEAKPAKPKVVAPKPKAVKVPKPKAVEIVSLAIPLMALQRKQCKWPVNDAARGEEHLFCGLPADGSYCEHHAERSVWVPITGKVAA